MRTQRSTAFIVSTLMALCFCASPAIAVPITLTATFLEIRPSGTTTIEGVSAYEILETTPELQERRNPDSPTALKQGTPDTTITPIGNGSKISTGVAASVTEDNTMVTFTPTPFDSNCGSECVIGTLDIFNGINQVGTTDRSFILDLASPNGDEVASVRWWLFIENTLNSPGEDERDTYTFSAASDLASNTGEPIAPIDRFFVDEGKGRFSLPVTASLSTGKLEPTDIVPEPSTYILFGSGLLGLFFWRLRNSRALHSFQPTE